MEQTHFICFFDSAICEVFLIFSLYNSPYSETRCVTVMFKHTFGSLPEKYYNINYIKEDDKPLRYNEEIVTRANTKLYTTIPGGGY